MGLACRYNRLQGCVPLNGPDGEDLRVDGEVQWDPNSAVRPMSDKLLKNKMNACKNARAAAQKIQSTARLGLNDSGEAIHTDDSGAAPVKSKAYRTRIQSSVACMRFLKR